MRALGPGTRTDSPCPRTPGAEGAREGSGTCVPPRARRRACLSAHRAGVLRPVLLGPAVPAQAGSPGFPGTLPRPAASREPASSRSSGRIPTQPRSARVWGPRGGGTGSWEPSVLLLPQGSCTVLVCRKPGCHEPSTHGPRAPHQLTAPPAPPKGRARPWVLSAPCASHLLNCLPPRAGCAGSESPVPVPGGPLVLRDGMQAESSRRG